jgi:signal transduction histidine kinase
MTTGTRLVRTRSPAAPRLPACLTGSRSTQFLVELAHDIRSPLTAILTLAESLQSGVSGPLSEGQRQQLGLIHASALRLCETTSDTLELARGKEGAPDQETAFSIDTILSDVQRTVMPMAEEKGLSVLIRCQASGGFLGRERPLRRTLLNLATNALKATERGSVQLIVTEAGPGMVEFAVVDTGPGMTLTMLRTLWQPFRPAAKGPHSIFSSAGLGLAICRKLVAEMGGELTVATELGVGSRFTFRIPLATAP